MSVNSEAPLVLATRDGYDRWAEIYDGEGNPLIALEEPEVERALGEVKGLEILDVGCGTGRHALRLARAGARVTAVDFSAGMLARAKAKPGAEAITWMAHDILRPLPFAKTSFDRVICGLVVDHVAGLHSFLGDLKRLVRPAGFIVVTVMHPAMMLRGVSARFVDPETGRETRPESFPNQISDYVMGATRAGLRLLELTEHAVEAELAEANPRAAKYLGWPLLFVMKLAG